MDDYKPNDLETGGRFWQLYQETSKSVANNPRHSPDCSSGWRWHLENVWGADTAKYSWIEYLFHEAVELRKSLPKVLQTEEEFEREERWQCIMQEFGDQLESVETDEQRLFVMQNLPFNRSK
ncbi:hypothetical protein [Adhaeretor mobilis]|uniref:Uncharacterized protein n=1 Tax=Adhaeretor mobilis TaxID=1930276 RepID=A0A517MTR6_9BACT|nr:hypothetical protein [Adhaeretor mobilis]QDS98281.1 hypothetical protein HG15A2_15540 [Adhaeretor mobilis]